MFPALPCRNIRVGTLAVSSGLCLNSTALRCNLSAVFIVTCSYGIPNALAGGTYSLEDSGSLGK